MPRNGLSLIEQLELVSSCGRGFKLVSEVRLKHGEACVIICPRGHSVTTVWREIEKKLSSSTFCKDCYMLNKVRTRASEKGFTFIESEWKGYDALYEFTCPEGHTRPYLWKYFNMHDGNHCLTCYEIRVSNGEHNQTTDKFKRDQEKKLHDRLKKNGYHLSEPFKYQSNKDRIKMVCSRGHDYEATFSHFMQGKKCRKCSYEAAKLTDERLTEELASMGYEYLGEYKGVNEPLKYRCTCGNVAYKRIEDLRRGQKCMRCAKTYSAEKRRIERLKALEEQFDTI